MIRFKQLPFSKIIKIFKRRYPKKKIVIQYVAKLKTDKGKKALGNCVFLEDGSYLINLNADVKAIDCLDVLCHELSHVAAGYANSHNKVFKERLNWLYDSIEKSMMKNKRIKTVK